MNFFSRYKKLFFFLGFLAASILIGFLLWKTFFSGGLGPQTDNGGQTNLGGNLPGASEGTGQIVDNQNGGNVPTSGDNGTQSGEQSNKQNIPGRDTGAVSPIANGGLTNAQNVSNAPTIGASLKNGAVQYYNELDGKFYRLDANGNIKEITDKAFPNVSNVVWSPDNQKAVMEYPDGSKSVYNFQTGQQVLLPPHWEDFSFSPDSSKISSKSIGEDPDNRYLIVANSDGSKAKAIEYIGSNAKDIQVAWSPNNIVAATYVKGVDFDRKEVFFIGFNGENMKSMVVPGRGFESKWSTSGDKMLYSVYSTGTNLKPKLWIASTVDGTIGAESKGITLNTWASKCTFANNDEMYCAVPKSLPEGAGLFPETADHTADDLYKVNLKTGVKNLIATPKGDYTISQVLVSDSQDKLYFTDKNTGQLYKVNLK
ncbi:MAG: hypothetical protein NT165_03835 [Candidatus Falkowbacteria bacterium]|nr:hypothetical protein [Candidatus Falkowbacteria bacterium]